jgi:hypothetical protein
MYVKRSYFPQRGPVVFTCRTCFSSHRSSDVNWFSKQSTITLAFSSGWYAIPKSRPLEDFLALITCSPFTIRGEPIRDHHLKQFVYSVSIRCYERRVDLLATLWFLQACPLPRIRALANRCLAMDYSGFQASCHNIFGVCLRLCTELLKASSSADKHSCTRKRGRGKGSRPGGPRKKNRIHRFYWDIWHL